MYVRRVRTDPGAVAASILPGTPRPGRGRVAAAALLGLGAHFANVLPDLAADTGQRRARPAATGRGDPGRPDRGPADRAGLLLARVRPDRCLRPEPPTRWPTLAGLGGVAILAVLAVRARRGGCRSTPPSPSRRSTSCSSYPEALAWSSDDNPGGRRRADHPRRRVAAHGSCGDRAADGGGSRGGASEQQLRCSPSAVDRGGPT